MPKKTIDPTSYKKSFKAVAIGHGVVFFILGVAVWAQYLVTPKSIHSFVLHTPSGPSAKQVMTQVATPSPAPIPKATKVEAQPEPEEPAPKAVQRISYEDFVKKQGKPKAPKVHDTVEPKRPVSSVKIDVSFINKELQMALRQGGVDNSELSADELQSYILALKQTIDRLWQKPQSLAGTDLQATVEFTVEPTGRVSKMRIIRGSSNALFDESVQKAFRRLGYCGTPPKGKQITFSLNFRMMDT